MIARYKRNARTFAELELGELAQLDAAIPELANARDCPPTKKKGALRIPKSAIILSGCGAGFEPTTFGS
jgi:hypothetical protein